MPYRVAHRVVQVATLPERRAALGGRLQGRVRGVIGNHQEERLPGDGAARCRVAPDEVDRLGGEHVGLVPAVGVARAAVVVQEPVPVVHDAAEEAGELREAALVGVVSRIVQAAVPLAHVAGAVAGGAECITDGALAQGDAVQAAVRFHAQRAAAVVVASGEQRGARRGADRRAAVVLGAAHALGGEPIDVGRGQDGVAVAAQVAVAQVVGQEDDDVGTRARRCGSHAAGTTGQVRCRARCAPAV